MTTLGKGITHIWPYGKKARLLMVWISTQVVRQKKHKTSRVIMLPFTLRQLMEDLGIQWEPRKTDYENFKRQISALSYSDIYAWLSSAYTLSTIHAPTRPRSSPENRSRTRWARTMPKHETSSLDSNSR